MSHLVSDDHGYLVHVVDHIEETGVDAYVVTEGAEGIEAGVIVDEIIVGLFVN